MILDRRLRRNAAFVDEINRKGRRVALHADKQRQRERSTSVKAPEVPLWKREKRMVTNEFSVLNNQPGEIQSVTPSGEKEENTKS